MSGERKAYISFPPVSIGVDSLRIPLLANTERYFVLNKPADVNAFQEKRLGGGGRGIVGAICSRASGGAGQFERLGIPAAWPINFPSREVSGIFLCAKTAEARAGLKNEMGSGRFRFVYHIVADEAPAEETLTCELPLASHAAEAFSYVSRKSGKKTSTTFRKLQQWPKHSLWETASPFDRVHQVRVHASESGVRIAGETVYRPGLRRPPPKMPSLSGRAPRSRLCLHLVRLTFSFPGEEPIEMEAPYPPWFRDLLRRVSRSPGGHIGR